METAPRQLQRELQSVNQRERLNRLYRFQRHFYDLTRRFFLFGRDDLLEQMDISDGDHVLEVGCGTGRNLLFLARRHPRAKFYGIDASDQMLKTAAAKFDANDMQKTIVLRQGLAERLDAEKNFALDEPFDVVFFSYTLSMIPDWRAAVDAALSSLKPEGSLYVVDFGDGRGLPGWFYRLLKTWLGLFDVRPRPELLGYLEGLARAGNGLLRSFPVRRHYAFIAEFRRF
jgi:S-adenosylmethionine-diacylgycerolhomoserine-N-methlytransferase